MKMLAIIFALVFDQIICIAQPIHLTQVKDSRDLEVVSGKYKMHFRLADIETATEIIDKKINSDHSNLINLLKQNNFRSVNLSSVEKSDQEFINFFKQNLGCYLISRGKVVINQNKLTIVLIEAEESPPMVELDGSSKIAIGYTEKGSGESIFIGELNTKLLK